MEIRMRIGILINSLGEIHMIKIDLNLNLSLYCDAIIIDMTAINKQNLFSRLSPYYPHGGIPIPNSPDLYVNSINEVWRILCTKNNGEFFSSDNTKIRFRKGVNINEFWTYTEARWKILIPLYCWMLENKAFEIVEYLRKQSSLATIVIIDRTLNSNINNLDEPLSCAFLLKAYIEGKGPYKDAMREFIEYHNVMIGSREYLYKKKNVGFRKIANIYTGVQRILDFG